MKDSKKAKWILGGSGVFLSALVLSQFSADTSPNKSDVNVVEKNYTKQQEKQMTNREKELVNLDWTNFEVVTTHEQQIPKQSDRTTKNS